MTLVLIGYNLFILPEFIQSASTSYECLGHSSQSLRTAIYVPLFERSYLSYLLANFHQIKFIWTMNMWIIKYIQLHEWIKASKIQFCNYWKVAEPCIEQWIPDFGHVTITPYQEKERKILHLNNTFIANYSVCVCVLTPFSLAPWKDKPYWANICSYSRSWKLESILDTNGANNLIVGKR